MELDNIKMWESLLKELWHWPQKESLVLCIKNALRDQGLQYNLDTKKIECIEPEQEKTLKGAVEARKEIITCAEDFQKQKSSGSELNEFESEIAHVLVYVNNEPTNTDKERKRAYQKYAKNAKFFAPLLLEKARKQITSEINIDERVQKFKDGVKENPHGILACLTLHGAYKLGMNDTLKAIKG